MLEKLFNLKQKEIDTSTDMLPIWRERIFLSIFITSIIAASIPYFLNMKIAITTGQILFGIILSLTYITAIIITFLNKIPFKIRVWVGLLLFYLVGILSLTTIGPAASGRMWLFMFAVLTTLILGLKSGIIALVVNLVTLGLWIWGWSKGYFAWGEIYQYSANQLFATMFSFLFMNAVVTISLGILLRVLKTGFEKEQNLSNELKISNSNLVRENEERKKTEDALKESEQKYRLLAENVDDMIWMLDIKSSRLTYVSPSVEKVRGYSPEEVMEQSLDEMLTPDSFQKIIKLLADELSKDQEKDPDRSVTIEIEQYRKDGSTGLSEVSASFVRNDQGFPTAVLGVTRDITERKRTEHALREKEEKLLRSRKMESMGLLAGGVAHDLNNILSGIVSYPELILMDLPEDSNLRKPIETIYESGQRATAIVQDLLTVARGVATAKEPLNINDIINEYLKSPELKNLKQAYPTVTIKTDLDTGLLPINGSHIHIRKVIMNLVINASEAVESSGNVSLSTMNRYVDTPLARYDDINIGEYVVLLVSDDGLGISSDDQDRIFEPFYTKKVMGRSGTGLGLSVVWNVMQDHEGYIDLKSNELGTTFELYFPITRDEISDKSSASSFANFKGKGEMILVIDDVESQREISCRMLEKLGYNTHAVPSGEEAVEYLKENSVDLLLLDMIMEPGISGAETYERIIRIKPEQKAVIVSGFSETDNVAKAQNLGAGKYIKKPLTIEKLGLAVKEELKK